MSNLPPGVTDSMIPGNTPEDAEWEQLLDAIGPIADDLLIEARNALTSSKHFTCNDTMLVALLCDALGVEMG